MAGIRYRRFLRRWRANAIQAATDAFGNALGQALAPNEAGQQQEIKLSPWLDNMIAQAVYTNTLTDMPLSSGGPQLTGNGVQYTAYDVAYGIDDDSPYDQIVHNGAGEEITAQDRWNEARNRADSTVTANYQEHYKRLEDAEVIARVNAQRAQESSAQNQRELNRTASLVEMNAQARADSSSVSWGANPRVGGGSSITAENGYTPAKSLIGDSYRNAVNGMLDSSNTPLQRLAFGGLAAATAIPGFANDLAVDAYNAPGNVYTGAQRITIGLATGDTAQLSAGLMQSSGGILGFMGILGATQSIVANEIGLIESQVANAGARATYNVTNTAEAISGSRGTVTGAQWNEFFSAKYGAQNVFWDWPKNQGFVYGADGMGSLQPGQLIGRLGNERGTFASPLGSTPETLSLRPGTDLSNLNVYRVIQEIPGTRTGPAAPAFDMPGYGTQHELPKSVKELLNPANPYLERVTK